MKFFTVESGLNSHAVCLALALCGLASLGCRDSKEGSKKNSANTEAKEDGNQGPEPQVKSTDSIPPSAKSLFETALELQHVYRNGQDQDKYSILESLGGGVGMLDYDVDGLVDLCYAGGGSFGENDSLNPANTCLQRNIHASGHSLSYVDRSSESGIAASTIYSHGIAVADYDNDGFPDVLVTGYGGLMLWHNCGDGTFEEISDTSGVKSTSWSSSAAWGDINNDGCVDLYVVNYVDWSFAKNPICKSSNGLRDVCPPRDFEGLPDFVFLNAGDGRFHEASRSLGLRRDGKGLGVVLADFNNDSWLDVYVANDTSANFLYLNQNGKQLEDSAELRGVAYDERGIPNGSMGVDVLDFNMDGLLDLWVANYEDETFALYRNVGNTYFMHVSKSTGVSSFGQSFVGFGTASGDFDLDGDEDILVSNGHVIRHPQRSTRRQKPLLLTNSNGRFRREEFSEANYFGQSHEGRGLAVGDLNNDGSLDTAISHLNDKACVLVNQGSTNRWVKLQLIGRSSNRDAIGASATLVTNQRKHLRVLKGGGSYLSSSDLTLHWGFSQSEEPQYIELTWPSGTKQTIDCSGSSADLIVVEPVKD